MNKIKASANGSGKGKGGKGSKNRPKSDSTKRARREEGSSGSGSECEDREVDRPLRNTHIDMSLATMKMMVDALKLPIGFDPEMMELAYRLLTVNNTLMKVSTEEARQGVEEAEAGAAVVAEGAMATAEQEKTPRFFRGNMSTTVLVNGVDQIRSYLSAPSWSAGIVRAVRDSGAYVQDVWMVKRQGTEVVSCLVQFSSRFQKLLALAALTDLRMDMQRTMGRVSSNRVNARDAFPREQLDAVKACYNRGYELKKAGLIESYRIYNTGEMSPTFEVRTKKDGKVVWGPPPPRSGETPPPHLTQRQRLRPARSGQRGGGEGMEIGDADSGTESYSPQNGTGRRGNGGAPAAATVNEVLLDAMAAAQDKQK